MSFKVQNSYSEYKYSYLYTRIDFCRCSPSQPYGNMPCNAEVKLVYCLQNGLPLDMDVYDLAEWCCLAELGELSMDNNCAPVEFPDFTRGDWNKVKGYRHAFATPEDEAEAARKAEAYTQKLKLQAAEDWK